MNQRMVWRHSKTFYAFIAGFRCFLHHHHHHRPYIHFLHILTMSKSRKAAVYATAAAFIAGTASVSASASASSSTQSSSFSHGGSATRIPCSDSDDGNGLDGLNVYSCPRGGGAKPDESKKKRKGRRRKSGKPSKDHSSETTDATPEDETSASTAAAPVPAKEDTQSQSQSQSPQQETASSNTSAEKDKPDAPKQKPQTPPTAIIDEIIKEKDYYKILGTTKQEAQSNSNPNNVIQKAYRRRAVQCHPDKTGGDRRAFDRVAEAYDVLSDNSKRQMYDRFGKDGLDPSRAGSAANRSQQSAGFGNGGGAEDIFRAFFGGSGRGSQYQQPQPRRNRTVRYQLEVTLEDLYQGMERTVLVAPPEGGSSTTASKRVHVNVPRGAVSGQSIVLSGEMDFDEDDTPGDLVFWLRERSHATFTRKGHDLAVAFQITLQEAICGVKRSIRHLDGSELNIGSAQHATSGPILIQTGDVQVLKGKGMPKDGQGVEFGDLYVQYQVEMPTGKPHENTLTSEEREELGRLLDKLQGKKHTQSIDQADIQFLQKASLRDFGRASGQPQPPQNNDPTRASAFGSRQFYSSSSRASNPFFELNQDYMPDGDDDSNVQCRPM